MFSRRLGSGEQVVQPRTTDSTPAAIAGVVRSVGEAREAPHAHAHRQVLPLDVARVYTLRGTNYFAVTPDRSGVVHAPVLAIELTMVDGPKLRLTWAGGTEEI